jgi:methyltransferase (TIGR00027 family)
MKDDSPSSTAYVIARSIVYLSGDPLIGRLIPPRAVEMSAWFVQARSRWSYRLLSTMRPLCRPFITVLERLSVPGIQLHYVLRKRCLEDAARAALDEGARQMVVIGGGFDTLALRLHEEYPAVRFIEIDHPATQRVKRQAAEAHHLPNRNLRFLSVDLMRKTLEQSLLACDEYREDAETFFLCEGVLMYLRSEEIEKMFRFIRGHSGPRSHFAFTFMESCDGRIHFRNSSAAVDAWLRFRGEVFTWGIPRDHLPGYLTSNGLLADRIATTDTLRSRYLAPERLDHLPLAEGECICVASIAQV